VVSSAFRLERCPLDEAALRDALGVPRIARLDVGASSNHAPLWRKLDVIASTASTNADVAAAAADGAQEGLVLIAEHQQAGKGRHDRKWISPPHAGLEFSVLLRPRVPMRSWGWLPLLAGIALAQALDVHCPTPVRLKWPNDLLLGVAPRKTAGILATMVPKPDPAIVVGIGVNVNTEPAELPSVQATSLGIESGRAVDRAAVLLDLLSQLEAWYERWQCHDADANACGMREVYRQRCHTLGKRVTLRLLNGSSLVGQAIDVDGTGRLMVANDSDLVPVAAGDVIKVG